MNKLKVLIMHHHMRGGGVTEVIRRTFSLFSNSEIELGLITGESTSTLRDIPDGAHKGVDGLSYGDVGIPLNPEVVYQNCLTAANALFDSEPDVWHIHNHSLGKNPLYTAIALRLIADGKKVLLHTHDFAEDNRPKNYQRLSESDTMSGGDLQSKMYPIAEHVRYATLNKRDARYLIQAGIPDSKLRVIANPVTNPFSGEPSSESDCKVPDNLILYPVRAIPRKNIGELVLWSALYANEATFGVTLAPQNPVYKNSYNSWVHFAEQLDLPLVFEVGRHWNCSYRELIASSKALITTSIAEGFGLVYLESFLMDKPLLGRNLRDITQDFSEHGISLDKLYPRLPVPVSWLGKDRLETIFTEQIQAVYKSYGKELTSEKIQKWLEHLLEDDTVDFGALNNDLQMEIIKEVCEQEEKATHLRSICQLSINGQPIKENKESVVEHYNETQYGDRLLQVYKQLSQAEPTDIRYVSSEKVLEGFLNPESFSLLRV